MGRSAIPLGLGLVGAAVGFVATGFNPAGAQAGFLIGSTAGSLLFPPKVPGATGPRLGDLKVQTSSYGVPIPIVFGSFRLAGNVIWSRPLTETKTKTSQGGKGGPKQSTTNFSYSASFAVGLCEGCVSSIRRIWANGNVVYDIREQQPNESDQALFARQGQSEKFKAFFTSYSGSETQDPDPLIQSFEPDTPAYRGLAYVVFEELPLADYGNRLPLLEFEVEAFPLVTLLPQGGDTCACSPTPELDPVDGGPGGPGGPGGGETAQIATFSNEVIYPWIEGTDDPRNPLNDHEYAVGATVYATLAEAKAAAEAAIGYTLRPDFHGWSNPEELRVATFDAIAPRENLTRHLRYNHVDVIWEEAFGREQIIGVGGNPDGNLSYQTLFALGVERAQFYYMSAIAGLKYGAAYYMGIANGDGSGAPSIGDQAGLNNCIPQFGCPYPSGSLFAYRDTLISVRRKPKAPSNPCDGQPSFGEGFCVIDGEVTRAGTFTYVDGTFKALSKTLMSEGRLLAYPRNPVLPEGDPRYDSREFWEAAYNAAVAKGEMPAGLIYPSGYPKTQTFAYEGEPTSVDVAQQSGASFGDIISHLARRAGLAAEQIDTSAILFLGTLVGYAITRPMPIREAIGPLRNLVPFDVPETDGKLRFVPRGLAPVATLTEDDLAAHETGSERPPVYALTRVQEAELPLQVRVKYARAQNAYEPGEQSAQRVVTLATNRLDIEVAAAISDQDAADIAQVQLYAPWNERQRFAISLAPKWFVLDPGDVILMPLDGVQRRLRIETTDFSMTGPVSLTATQEDAESYALEGSPGGSGTADGNIAIIGPSGLLLLDIPSSRTGDDDSGIYAATYALIGNYRPVAIFRSADDGESYSQVAVNDEPATLGTVSAPASTGPATIIDAGNTITVRLITGTLESISRTRLNDGENAAAIGAHGRWEIVQFQNATLQGDGSWLLSNLARGRRGTEHLIGTGLAGDAFVLLDSGVNRVPPRSTDIDVTHLYKAVPSGSTLEEAEPQTITVTARTLACFSPTFVRGQWLGGDLVIDWLRRDRALVSELPGFGGDVPLSDAPERYRLEVLNGMSVVRTIETTTPNTTYTAAQITADFGSTPERITVRIAQRNKLGLPGTPTTATLSRGP